MALPTNSSQYKWIVLRRVVSGGQAQVPEPAFQLEHFDRMVDGSARFDAIDKSFAPMLVTATDGTVLVLSLRQAEPKQRAVAH
jgi:hypothetical protein